MILSRELGKRIWGGSTNMENGGGGVSSDAIAGLLTGYAKESWVDEHYISIDFFSRLFQAHGTENGSEIDVMPNDLETTITSVESMFGFWTNLYISALGSNGAAPAGISLGMLTDVTISGTPSAGQVLTFDAVSGMWVNGNAQAGATALANLTDVTLSQVQNGQTLLYDSTNSRWYNSALKTINGQSLLGSGDISVGGGASGNYLPLSGGTLYNTTNAWIVDMNNWYNSSTGSSLFFGHGGAYGLWCGVTGSSTYLAKFYRNMQRHGYSTDIVCYIGAEGRVGIITEDPTSELDVRGAVRSNYIQFFKRQQPQLAGFIGRGSSQNDDIYITAYAGGSLHLNANDQEVINVMTNLRVGIGTISPSYKLHVNGNFGAIGSNSDLMAQISNEYSGYITTIRGCYSNGYGLYIGTSRSDSAYILQCGSNITGTGGESSVCRFIVLANGNIGINNNSPSYTLHVSGTIYATGAITALSDARKKDITGEAGVTVEQIAHAPAVQFLWKDKERRNDGQQVGTLAQYWRAVLPEVVSDKGGELSMQYGVAALVSAIVTARKVVDHERRIHELEKENERLKEEISQLRLN